ncbi:MAG: D-alanyl-D-alanine carboxypeptidase/D-alanyl-D-alanine-endopeptidase, partial [Actinobacteria bacterium]
SALTINDGFAAWIPEAIRGDDPARSAAATFSRLLAERGVAVEGEPAAGMAPQGAVEIAGIDSAPLRDVAAEALRESDNTTAELLLKLVGRYVQLAPSTAGGAAVVEAHLGALGLPLAGTDVVDGSGLDRGNRVTCDLMVGLLDRVGPDSVLASGLAVAGETGTLIRRFQGTPVQGVLRAKSGSINGVLTLAGMVDLADGSTVSFAVLQNGPGVDRRGHAVWENLLAAILGVPSWKA